MSEDERLEAIACASLIIRPEDDVVTSYLRLAYYALVHVQGDPLQQQAEAMSSAGTHYGIRRAARGAMRFATLATSYWPNTLSDVEIVLAWLEETITAIEQKRHERYRRRRSRRQRPPIWTRVGWKDKNKNDETP
jgi:hypothetical protein